MSQLAFNFDKSRRGVRPRAKAAAKPAQRTRKRTGPAPAASPIVRAYLARIGRKGAAATNRKRKR